MSTTPFFQFYPADYLADTGHLTTEQHGAYLLLLMTAWPRGGRLPNDPAKLARITGVSLRRWHIVGPDVVAFFAVDGDEIVSERMARDYQNAVSKSQKRSVSGKAGARAKALKTKDGALANAMRSLKHSPEPEPERDISPSSSISPSPARPGSDTPAAAEPRPVGRPPKGEPDPLEDRIRTIREICEPVMVSPARSPAVTVLVEPRAWAARDDFESFVVPVLRAVAARRNRGDPPVSGWAYFGQALASEAERARSRAANVVPIGEAPVALHPRAAERQEIFREMRERLGISDGQGTSASAGRTIDGVCGAGSRIGSAPGG